MLFLDEGNDAAELIFLLLPLVCWQMQCCCLVAVDGRSVAVWLLWLLLLFFFFCSAHTLIQQQHCMDGNRANANELILAVAIGLTFAFLVVLGSVPSSGEESALLLLLLFAACQRRRR